MDSHDGQREPDSALILAGIRSLHDRLSDMERRVTAGEPPGRGPVPAWRRPTRGEARWQVALAVAVAVALQYRLPGRLVLVHPFWVLPTLQVLLLIALVMANPHRINTQSRVIRLLSLTLPPCSAWPTPIRWPGSRSTWCRAPRATTPGRC